MRKSTVFVLVTAANAILLSIFLLHGKYDRGEAAAARSASAEIVRKLRLTDLCLFTEARYTRHPSMTDFQSPFQDHPLALEHFPSGALVTPPGFRREGP